MKIYILIILTSLLCSTLLVGQDFFAAQNGDWNDGGTWGNSSPGIPGTDWPGAGDVVAIDGFTISLPKEGSFQCDVIFFTYNIANQLVIGGGRGASPILTISEALVADDGAPNYIPTAPSVQVFDPNIDFVFTGEKLSGFSGLNGILDVWSSLSPFDEVTITQLGASPVKLEESMTVTGNLIISNGQFTISSAGDLNDNSLSGLITVNASTILDVQGSVSGGTDATNFNNIVTVGSSTIVVGLNGFLNSDALTLDAGSTLNVTNNQPEGWWHSSSSGPISVPIDVASTINYNRIGAQGIFAGTYGNLTMSGGSGTKSLSSGVLNVLGDLFIGGGNTFDTSGSTSTITINGSTHNDGTWSSTQTVEFDANGGTVPQAIDGAAAITFGNTVSFMNDMDINTSIIFNNLITTGGNNLSFSRDLTNNGLLIASGTLTFDGTLPQSITGSTMTLVENMVIDNSGTGVTINGTGTTMYGTLTLNANAKFNANGLLTLRSNDVASTGTARVASVPNTATFSGSINFERYISGGQRWHNIGLPVIGSTADIIGSGYPDPDASLSGDIVRYNESTFGNIDQGWESSKNFGYSTLNDNQGYSFWTRTADDLGTLTFSGLLNTGNMTLPTTFTDDPGQPLDQDGWNLVNNPYASQIDWGNPGWTKTRIDASAYVWNGTAYVTINGSGTIASGQSFWVKANAALPILLTTQAAITSGSATFYRTAEEPNQIAITLKQGEKSDLVRIRFKDDATEEFDSEYDGYKLQNSIYNFSSLTETGLDLSINSLPMIACNRVVNLNMTNISEGAYQLEFDGLFSFDAAYDFTLKDSFLGTSTILEENLILDFNVTADVASYGDGRFEIELSAATIDTSIEYEILDECNFSSSLTFTNAQVGVTYTLVQAGLDIVSKFADSTQLILPLTEDQVKEGLNLFDLKMDNGECGSESVPSAIEFTINQFVAGTVNYQMDVACDFESSINILNAQEGVTYTLIQNNVPLISEVATGLSLSLSVPNGFVVEGLNNFDLELSNGSCGKDLLVDAIEYTVLAKESISSVTNALNCGPGSVLLKAEGATGNSYYNWYESATSIDPIPNQNSGEYITPEIETTKFYYVSIVNEAGCESMTRTKVSAEIVNVAQPDIQVEGSVISTSSIADSYQWYNDGELIEGETTESITVKESGIYSVVITTNTCSATSENIIVEILGIKDLEEIGIKIYPNPVIDVLKVTSEKLKINSIFMYDTKGIEILRFEDVIPNEIDMKTIKKGIYIINIATVNQTITYRVRKK